MSEYRLYIRDNGFRVITKDDLIEWRYYIEWKYWVRDGKTFFGGDIALDNGFKYKGIITEEEIFAEML
jgi:hypothetical protein